MARFTPSRPGTAPRSAPRAVFAEPSGRRWRAVQAGAVLLLVALTALVVHQLSGVFTMLRTPLPGPSAESVVARLGPDPAVIGNGPLVRVVSLRGGAISDPFTGGALGSLSDDDKATTAGTAAVALQRYGYGPISRRLVLTFDDGPDPVWTPELLDVLARHHIRATFFVTGRAASMYPDLLRRIVAAGHVLGNHSLSHRNLSDVPEWRARLELAGNEHLLAGLTGQDVGFVRPPYDGGTAGAVAQEALAIARCQQLGRPVASYDFDTHDWAYGGGTGDSAPLQSLPATIPLPPLDGRNLTVLMHDAGGNRAHTVDYLEHSLIPAAEAAGYTFATVPQANPGLVATPAAGPNVDDRAVNQSMHTLVMAWLVYPNRLTGYLFVLAVFGVAATGILYAALAGWRRWRHPPPPARRAGDPGSPLSVSVVIAAYNESTVIEATLRSLVRSRYPVREFMVVDDGSTDDTAAVVEGLARSLDTRIRLIRQPNGKKPVALNNALRQTDSEIVVTVDADTHADPELVGGLLRHFEADPFATLAAVAGVVRVGNSRENLLTRWQALEYLHQIGVERAAHDLLGSITIVPGACAAWRRDAVLRAGGFSSQTLAEDCDLTLTLHRTGWRVTQDDEARADTEAPEDVDSLLRQRVRWTFGTLQAITKHRDMLLRPRYGWLGMLVLPWAVASIVVPLLTIPFVVLMSILIFTTVGPAMLGGYYLAFTAVQGVTAAVAVLLLRERLSHLLMVPLYRLVYEPLRAYLLYKTGYLAVRGVPVGWNKLVRSGTLNRSPVGGAAAVATPGATSAATEADPPQRPVVRPVIPRQQGAPERDAGAASGSGTANEPLR